MDKYEQVYMGHDISKLMCSIMIRDRLSVIVWRGATLSCRCLEREVSPVASSYMCVWHELAVCLSMYTYISCVHELGPE